MHDDRGEAVAQTVLAVPVVLSIMWIALQVTVLMHAAHVASAAASGGASVASQYGGSLERGVDAAARMVHELGATAASSPIATRDANDVVVRVSIRLPRIAPFFPTVITRSAREVRERFITEKERSS